MRAVDLFGVRREVYDVGMTGAKAQGNILMSGEQVTINQRINNSNFFMINIS